MFTTHALKPNTAGKLFNTVVLSRSTVKRAVKDLEKHGYLEKEPRYRDNGSLTSNLYRIIE